MLCFYSTLVRLKAQEHASPSRGCEFLFHIGAIKRICFAPICGLLDAGFYSTLVRLKEFFPDKFRRFFLCFYSTLVRLKVRTSRRKLKRWRGFYSTLVRLKVLFVDATDSIIKRFYSTLVRLKGYPKTT